MWEFQDKYLYLVRCYFRYMDVLFLELITRTYSFILFLSKITVSLNLAIIFIRLCVKKYNKNGSFIYKHLGRSHEFKSDVANISENVLLLSIVGRETKTYT